MSGNFGFVREYNEEMYSLCKAFESKLKTNPVGAMEALCEAVPSFVALMCADNDVAFDRYKSSTVINMIYSLLESGIISAEDKVTLDALGAFAYSMETGAVKDEIDVDFAVDKAKTLFGVIKKYYGREDVLFNWDKIPIDDICPEKIIKYGKEEDVFDVVYLCTRQDGDKNTKCRVAQFGYNNREISNILKKINLNKLFAPTKKTDALIPCEKLDTKGDGGLIFLCASLPRGYKNLEDDFIFTLGTKERILFMEKLALAICEMHNANLCLCGHIEENIYIKHGKRNKTEIKLGGLDECLGKKPYLPLSTKEDISCGKWEDIFSFARLLKKFLPESKGFKGALPALLEDLGKGNRPTKKPKMEYIRKIMHKSCRKFKGPYRRLSDIESENQAPKEELYI